MLSLSNVHKVFQTKNFLSLVYYSTAARSDKERSIIAEMDRIKNLNQIDPKRHSKRRWKQFKSASKRQNEIVRIVTYNILWNLFEDNRPPNYRWTNRYDRVGKTMLNGSPEIIGLQEDRKPMLDDLHPYYSHEYIRVGEPGTCDECCSILFKKERFDLLDFSRLKLSRLRSRHLTCVTLHDRVTEKVVRVFNTHLHFSSLELRQQQTDTLSEYMQSILEEPEENERVILLGDFNTFPNRPDVHTRTPLDGEEIEAKIEDSGLVNSMRRAIFGCIGPKSSYTNSEKIHRLENRCVPFTGFGVPGVYLDNIYTCRKIQMLVHAVNPVLLNGLFGSDHMPIVCDLLLTK
jgi:endonuclease/exonuclease/phosphatase family metal-dependent hydrolase